MSLVFAALAIGFQGQVVPARKPYVPTRVERVVYLTNLERAKADVPPLKAVLSMTEAAQGHAADMAKKGYFDHRSLDGREMMDRVKARAYEPMALAENIFAGSNVPETVVKAWMDSPGHKTNMLSDRYREIGVGWASNPAEKLREYWVANYGMRNGSFPIVLDNEAPMTSKRTVRAYLYGKDKMETMALKVGGAGDFGPWKPYQESFDVELPDTTGKITVFVKTKDATGRVYLSEDSIILE